MYKIVFKGLLIAVAVILIFLLLFRNRLPFGGKNSSFGSDPHKEITRIEFSGSGKKLSLEKKGDKWIINGRTEARKSGILFIIRVLREMEIKSPVSPDLFRSEITDKGINPVKIRVFDERKLFKSFLVYKTRSNMYGNIMKIRERSKPFIVCVPGFDGDIGSAFTLNELFWQPYTVFNLLPSEIESVNLENFDDPSDSFIITSKDHHFVLSSDGKDLSGWDPALVTRYLSYFAWIPFEKWALDLSDQEKKTVGLRKPLYRITISTSAGKKLALTLWEKIKEEEGSETRDSDRLLGRTEASDEFFVMRYFDIDPILKKKSYFFPE
jgi:hypothetical protein